MGEFDYKGEGKGLLGRYVQGSVEVLPADVSVVSLDEIRSRLPEHYKKVVLGRLPSIPTSTPFDQHTFTVIVDDTGRIIEAVQG